MCFVRTPMPCRYARFYITFITWSFNKTTIAILSCPQFLKVYFLSFSTLRTEHVNLHDLCHKQLTCHCRISFYVVVHIIKFQPLLNGIVFFIWTPKPFIYIVMYITNFTWNLAKKITLPTFTTFMYIHFFSLSTCSTVNLN